MKPLRSSALPVIALFAILMILAATVIAKRDHREPVPDNYERYAYSLAVHGTFAEANGTQAPMPGMGRAPLVPFAFAAMALLDDTYLAMLRCHVSGEGDCSWNDARSVHVAQMIAIGAAILLLFRSMTLVGVAPWIAVVVAALPAREFLKIAWQYRSSEPLALLCAALLVFCLARWFGGRGTWKSLAAAGIAVALLSLSRVAYLYLVPLLALAVLAVPPRGATFSLSRRIAPAIAVLVAACTLLAPWILRNQVLFDRPAIGGAGVDGVLAKRTMYNRMTVEEAGAAMLLWMPDLVSQPARKTLPQHLQDRVSLTHPTSIRSEGWAYVARMRREVPDEAERHAVMLRAMLEDPVRHALVSVPMAVRGLRDVWIFVPLTLVAMFLAVRRREWWVLGVLVPALFTLAFHAGATHFRARYGLPMTFGFAWATGWASMQLLASYRSRRARPASLEAAR